MDLGLGQHLKGLADLRVRVRLGLGPVGSAAFQLLADLMQGSEQHEAVGRRSSVAAFGEISLVHGELGEHQLQHLLLDAGKLGTQRAVVAVDVGGCEGQLVALALEGEFALERRGGAVGIPGDGVGLSACHHEAGNGFVEVEGVGIGLVGDETEQLQLRRLTLGRQQGRAAIALCDLFHDRCGRGSR